MATHFSVLAWRIPWTEKTWQATVHGVTTTGVTEHTHATPSVCPTLSFAPPVFTSPFSMGQTLLKHLG